MKSQIGRRKIKFKRKEESAPEPESQDDCDHTISPSSVKAIGPTTLHLPRPLGTPKAIRIVKECYENPSLETYSVQVNGIVSKRFNTRSAAHDYVDQLNMNLDEYMNKEIIEEEMEELGKCLDSAWYDRHWM